MPRVPAAERIAVRCVDSDVHPMPRRGELVEYIPEPWRTKYFLNHKVGDQIYYDAPDYAHSYAMRVDSFPPDGEFAVQRPGSGASSSSSWRPAPTSRSWSPPTARCGSPRPPSAFCTATNQWLANHWLDSHNNWHERWRGSICVAIEDPKGAVARSRSGPSIPTCRRS